MNWSIFGIVGAICFVGIVFMLELLAIVTISGYIATYMGLNGILWWSVAVFLFIVINAVLGALVSLWWD